VGAGQWAHRRDQLIAHPRDEEATEATLTVRDAEGGEARVGELSRRVDELLEDLLDRPLGRDRQHRVGNGFEWWAKGFGGVGYLLQASDSGCVIGPLWNVIVMLPVHFLALLHFGGLVISEYVFLPFLCTA
jgi:hypothetical protein